MRPRGRRSRRRRAHQRPARTAASPAGGRLPGRFRWACRYAFLAITFVATGHHNLGAYFPDATAKASAAPVVGPIYDAVVETGDHLGMSTTWRMYSPVPERVRVVKFSLKRPDGTWVEAPFPDLGRAHRARRSLADALLFDFKLAVQNYRLLYAAADEHGTNELLAHHARRLARQVEFAPQAVRAVVKSAPVPPPSEKGDWDPLEADKTNVLEVHEFP